MKSLIKSNATRGLLEKSTQIVSLIKGRLEPTIGPIDQKVPVIDVYQANKFGQEGMNNEPKNRAKDGFNLMSYKALVTILITFVIGFMVSWEVRSNLMNQTELYRINWRKELSSIGSSEPSTKYDFTPKF